MGKLIKLLFLHLSVFAVFTSVYLALFHTGIFQKQSVFFYRGIKILVLLTVLGLVSYFFLRKFVDHRFESYFAAILVSASINLSLFVVLPVTFERSVTMFYLNTLDKNANNKCGGLTKKQIEQKIINEYVIDKAVDKRTNEQELIGFVKKNSQCVGLTEKAKVFIKLSNTIGQLYGLDLR